MAAETNNKTAYLPISGKNDRDQMNKLRDSGQEYLAMNGQLIPAKKPPAMYCVCPQLCQRKLSREQWEELFVQFYGLADQNKQNMFLKTHITIHVNHSPSRYKTAKRKPRVACRYMVPLLQPGQHISEFLYKPCKNVTQVCQKAFMNALGITEKRIRMLRERSIASSEGALESPKQIEQGMEVPEPETDVPLDLSNSRSCSIDIDKTKLYELAETLGISRQIVDREMIQKYEQMVKSNLKKRQESGKRKVKEGPHPSLRSISEQVFGLEENLAILPMQTLNNGDLTITPLLGPTAVENQDIMTVNQFFQNQLWRPELIGLPAKSDSPIFI